MNFKVLVVFSIEAHRILEEKGQAALIKSKKVSQGYDWDYREFKNDDELAGYLRGLDDGNGWDYRPEVSEVPVQRIDPEDIHHVYEWVIFDKDGKFLGYREIKHASGALYIQNGQFERELRLKNRFAHLRSDVDDDYFKNYKSLREKLEKLGWDFPASYDKEE